MCSFSFLVAVGVLAGAPIAFVFAIATFSFLAITTHTPLTVVVNRMDEGMSHIVLLSVPLFVFLGLLIEATGMARAMVDFLAKLLGHVRGGLSYVLLGAMYLVSGISGSKAADMAAVAPVLFPEMKRRGARPGELVALLSSSGAMSETIPPSLVLITIGSVTGVSIAALFNGGLLPALVLALALCVIVWRRYRDDDLSHVTRASWSEAGRAFIIALPGLALPFLIRAAVVEGVATATEVSTIGIAYTIIVCFIINRSFPISRLVPMLVETASLCGAILLIIGAATAMAWALTQSGFSRDLAAAMTGLPGGAVTFMIVSIIAFVILGSVLEGIPAIVLFRSAVVSHCAADWHPRGALLNCRYPRYGRRAIRTTVWHWLLRSLCHWTGEPGRGHAPNLAISVCPADRTSCGCGGSVDFDWLPQIVGPKFVRRPSIPGHRTRSRAVIVPPSRRNRMVVAIG